MTHPNLDSLLSKLRKVQQSHPGQWSACCPAHDDNNPSMSIALGDGGGIVVHCHARQCPAESIAAAVGFTLADFAPSVNGKHTRELTFEERVERCYDYHDERGNSLYQVVRLHSPKDFRQRHISGAKLVRDEVTGLDRRVDVWEWKKGLRQVPYRLPELLASTGWVFIVEGEKDADNLAAVGIAATCNAGGAGKWSLIEKELKAFRGRKVAIVPDNDSPGLKHAVQVAESLSGIAADIRVVDLSGAKDASDWLAAGGTAERLMTLVNLAPAWNDNLRTRLLARADELNQQREAEKKAAEPKPVADPEVHLTDVGNAARFAKQHRDKARYCATWKSWLIWCGSHWERDERHEVDLLAKETVRMIFREAGSRSSTAGKILNTWKPGETDENKQLADNMAGAKALAIHALKSEAGPRIAAMLRLAQSELSITPGQLDHDPFLFNCRNGTIDLRTGEFRPHRREDYLTRVAPVTFDPKATCPDFERALRSIFPEEPLTDDAPGCAELIEFVQRLMGMCLSGDVSEQILAIFYGEGGNGKSVLLETICKIMGQYAGPAPEKLLLVRNKEEHPTELADLEGRRLVHATETGEGARLDETRVKKLTGGDTLKARRVFENHSEFEPTHKLIISTNHRPRIRGTDNAIWRRVLLVPFKARFWDPKKKKKPGENRIPRFEKNNRFIQSKFAHEHVGILNWLLAGCRSWIAQGLGPPEQVLAAVEEYQQGEDLVERFVKERIKIGTLTDKVKSGTVYAAFGLWLQRSGEKSSISRKAFATRLIQITGCSPKASNGRWFQGIDLLDDDDDGSDDSDPLKTIDKAKEKNEEEVEEPKLDY